MHRINNLTGIRAVAALWVVLFHLNILDTPVNGRLGEIVSHGLFGVDIFFVLSGFVLSMVYVRKMPSSFSWAWYRQFLGRRFAKIYPLHLLTLIAVIVLFKAAENVHVLTRLASNNLWNAVCSALMLHAFGLTRSLSWNMQSWSVSAEWFAYALLFTPMVYGLARFRTRTVLAGMAILLACMGAISIWVGTPWTILTTAGVLRILPEFLCGYLLFRIIRGRTLLHGDLLTAAGIAGIVLVCYVPSATLWLLVPSVMTILAGLYAGGFIADRIFGNRYMVALGDASYSIYLTQWITTLVIKQGFQHVRLENAALSRILIPTAVLLGTAITGLCSFRWIEEPLRQMLVRRFESKRNNPENIASPTAPGLQADTQVSATIG